MDCNRCSSNLEVNASRMKAYADKHRHDVNFVVGDRVFVHREWLTPPSMRSRIAKARKLSNIWVGPYEVLERVGKNAYRLLLPTGSLCHDVINVTALKKYHEPRDTSRKLSQDPVITDNGEIEYEVESIWDHSLFNRNMPSGARSSLEFHVAWKGFPPEEASWEPVANIKNAPEVIQRYLATVSPEQQKQLIKHPDFKKTFPRLRLNP